VLVNDNQDVQVGDTLVELDPADYQSRVDQASASVMQAQAQLAQARAQQTVYEAQLAQSVSNVGAAEANRTNVSSELRRYRELRENNAAAVSQQQLESAVAADANASAQVEVSKKAVAGAEAQLGYVRSQIEAAQAQIKSAQAQLEQAKLNLSYTQIKAQLTGRVAKKTVSPGNNVQAGADLMAIVPKEIYVTANFKETQLAHMRAGQSVKLKSDAYPDLKLTGKVDSVQPGTGQAFSVLPAENATGNWVKVVQRVPVKILLDALPSDNQTRLAPGMSVEATVKVE
jgi:membrane fusion protein (multidrug efflux system)